MRVRRQSRLAMALLVLGSIAAGAAPELVRCNTALDRGDFAAAARDAQAYVKLHPESAEAHVILARAEMGLNNAPAALNQLHAALRREPGNVDALYYLSKLADVLSHQEFMALARMAPDSARVHQLQADGFAAQGKEAEAEREYLAALERRPGTPAILNGLGELNRQEKKYTEALEWYGKVLEKYPSNYDALYGSGACYLRLQEAEKSVRLFRAALQADPSSVAAKMALGEALLSTGKAAEALPLLEGVAAYDPKLRRLQFLLARAYKETGRDADAKRAQDRYRELAAQEEEETGNPESTP